MSSGKSWANTSESVLQSYSDGNFQGDKLARDESIEFLPGEIRLKTFLAAVATLSKDTKAFNKMLSGKSIDLVNLDGIATSKASDIELREFQELQARLKVLIRLQLLALHRNVNIPDRDKFVQDIDETKEVLFDVALALNDEDSIRMLATQIFRSVESTDLKIGVLIRLDNLYRYSQAVTATILDLIESNDLGIENPLDILERFYGDECRFETLVASQILGNFESYLPRNYNDLDQALLLRFVSKIMGPQHVDEVYDRFIKLDVEGEDQLELVILDRMAFLKHRDYVANSDSLVEQFRRDLSEIDSLPEGWSL